MIEHLEAGDLLVLDLHSECRPQWGIRHQNGVAKGDMDNMGGCIVCFEFGGNIGLHGKMDALINGFMMRKQITMPERRCVE